MTISSSSRRRFLQTVGTASAVMAFGRTAPGILRRAAGAAADNGRILVVVEMAGGNDGLNTVIPFDHDAYRKSRPKLGVAKADVLKVGDGLGFHPAMTGFADLLNQGKLAVVQGVGYPNPNRSHFESMDIWHTCQRKDAVRPDGWLGRFLETLDANTSQDPAALHLGSDKQPFALMSREIRVPSIRSLDQFRLNGSEQESFRDAVRSLAAARRDSENDLLGFVQSSTEAAISASERIGSVGMQKASADAPETALGEKLKTVSDLIASGLESSVYYVRIDGFDTHASQPDAHAGLLRQVSNAVSRFVEDSREHGFDERVLTLCFSEFGRRVQENASEGTDHGTAGPMFLAGNSVNAGFVGDHPNLNDLADGDLKHHTDFRQVYATVLRDWLECDPAAILMGDYESVSAIRQNAG